MYKVFRILGRRGRITIPYEIRQRLGCRYNDLLSFSVADTGDEIIIRREKLCDDCKDTAAAAVPLLDYLNGLSESDQRMALIHLSLLWAERQGGDGNGGA